MAPFTQFLSEAPEANELFVDALDYHLGRNGKLRNPEKAATLYAQAAAHLERVCTEDPAQVSGCLQALAALMDFFMRAMRIGSLGSSPNNGAAHSKIVVPMNRAGTGPLTRDSASLADMTRLGINCLNSGNLEGGKRWLHKALKAGHGDAAYYLALYYYNVDKNVRNMLISLKKGARKGSERCSRYLCTIYELGLFGQRRNPKLAKHYAGRAIGQNGVEKKEKKPGAIFGTHEESGAEEGLFAGKAIPPAREKKKGPPSNGVVTWLR